MTVRQVAERLLTVDDIRTRLPFKIARRTFAARHLREGRTMLEVQKLGGWKSYRMVAEVYGHLERSWLDDAMRSTGADLVHEGFAVATSVQCGVNVISLPAPT
jgi:integrase